MWLSTGLIVRNESRFPPDYRDNRLQPGGRTTPLFLASVPAVWAIGIVVIIIGLVYIFRGSPLGGGILAVLGIPMGGLNVLDTLG
jgi:hypothetical protein